MVFEGGMGEEDFGSVKDRIQLLINGLRRLCKEAVSIVEGTFFEFCLKWYFIEHSESDEAVRKIRDLFLSHYKVALRWMYFLQDLSSFAVAGRGRGGLAKLLKTEIESLTGEMDEMFIVAASRINEFERFFEEVGLLEKSRRMLVEGVNEWDKVKKEIRVLHSFLADEASFEDAASVMDDVRRFILKFIDLFDVMRERRKDEDAMSFLKKMDEAGEFCFDFFWMVTIAGYYAARSIEVLVSAFKDEEGVKELMSHIREGRDFQLVLPDDFRLDALAFSLVCVRHELYDGISAVMKALEMARKAADALAHFKDEEYINILKMKSEVEKWVSEAEKMMREISELQSVVEKEREFIQKGTSVS